MRSAGKAPRVSNGPEVRCWHIMSDDGEGTALEEPRPELEETSPSITPDETADLCASSNQSSIAWPASTPEQPGRTESPFVETTISTPRIGAQGAEVKEGMPDAFRVTNPGTPHSDTIGYCDALAPQPELHISRFPPNNHWLKGL